MRPLLVSGLCVILGCVSPSQKKSSFTDFVDYNKDGKMDRRTTFVEENKYLLLPKDARLRGSSSERRNVVSKYIEIMQDDGSYAPQMLISIDIAD